MMGSEFKMCVTWALPQMLTILALIFSHLLAAMAAPHLASPQDSELDIRRSDFPKGFIFGSATSAYQVEGMANAGGRGPSIWDTYARIPGKILDSSNGDVAVDEYHRYEEDVDLLKSLNMDAYRFSISWSRIIPDGVGPKVNQEGIDYYNRLIDALLRKGIQPYVTIYHWDLPQALYDSLDDGWPNKEIVPHFTFFAEVCFREFGDRVKNWITFNEPATFLWDGYGSGLKAPGRTSDRSVFPVGNSSTEPYLGAHNVLLSHAAAVDVYRRKFKAAQGGEIGMTLDCVWAEPMTDSPADVEAAERQTLFQLGWYLDPIFFGDYPAVMRARAGDRLPQFSPEEKELLSGSLDFIGLNHYTTRWVTNDVDPNDLTIDFRGDQGVLASETRDGVPIGPTAFSSWLFEVPWGIEALITWVWERYKLPILVTENGMDTENLQKYGEPQPLPADFDRDPERVKYFQQYLANVLEAVRKGADVRGYFVWSFLDNFEWLAGYSSRFGIVYVDYNTLERYPKDSARWWAKFLGPKEEEREIL